MLAKGNAVESWNGTSWTEIAEVNNSTSQAGSTGSQTSALTYGGNDHPNVTTESWDGSSWTAVGAMSTSRVQHAGEGGADGATALATGGAPPTSYGIATTEEWNDYSSDASVTLQNTGQVFYRSDTGDMKVTLACSWYRCMGFWWKFSNAGRSGLGGAGSTNRSFTLLVV